MINFHKYSFLDAKKLKSYLNESNFWLCRYNPIWLFVWSDLYKPEIAFTNTHCFIRFLMPDVGMVYYPPLGPGDFKKGIEEIKLDANESGIDFNIGPADEMLMAKLQAVGIKLYECVDYNSYIYLIDNLAFNNTNKLKEKKKLCQKFGKNMKNSYFKPIKKEEFPQILEFINDWQAKQKPDPKDHSYFAKLNMIKKCIEHLYELDMVSILLRDEEKIYGVAIGSVMDNVASLHVVISDSDTVGAKEELISCFCKVASLQAKYVSFEEDLGIKAIRKQNNSYNPFKLEKFYATFNI